MREGRKKLWEKINSLPFAPAEFVIKVAQNLKMKTIGVVTKVDECTGSAILVKKIGRLLQTMQIYTDKLIR